MKIDQPLLSVMQQIQKDGYDSLSSLDKGFIDYVKLKKRTLYQAHLDILNGNVKTYHYMYTFTKDPSLTAGVPNEKIYAYIVKQFHRKPLQIYEAHIVQEGNDQGTHVHWHIAFSSFKAIDVTQFRYYTKIYGTIDPSDSKCHTIQESLNYMSKEATPTKLFSLS